MEVRGLVIAGTHSGVGKTSLATGLMGALARRGHAVAPFKVGPDYIDPTYHSAVAGRPSRNLDTWLMPEAEAVGVFRRAIERLTAPAGAKPVGAETEGGGRVPMAVVEGVMGLFDGLAGGGGRCSTAEMAKLLGLPVVLVVDSSHMAGSVGALVHGFAGYDPDLTVAGLILNKVAGSAHAAMLQEALSGSPPVVGVVPREASVQLESRHLGLIPTVEDETINETLARLVDHVEAHVDLDALCAVARPAEGMAEPLPGMAAGRRPRVAVARDAAFSFYYQDNLDVLEEEGAQVVPFSPLAGEGLPECDALYLGGGYPEVYAAELGANFALRDDLRRAAAAGLPIYAECGGYLYLGREIEYGSARHPMAGLLPTRATMAQKRLRMGYIEAEAIGVHPLAGAAFRGHLFHYSTTSGSESPAYLVRRKGERLNDGWAGPAVVASYVHLHFRGSRAIARWLASGGVREGGPSHAS